MLYLRSMTHRVRFPNICLRHNCSYMNEVRYHKCYYEQLATCDAWNVLRSRMCRINSADSLRARGVPISQGFDDFHQFTRPIIGKELFRARQTTTSDRRTLVQNSSTTERCCGSGGGGGGDYILYKILRAFLLH